MRLSSESRIEFVKATKSDRKSGILRRVGSKNLDTSIRVSHPLQRTQRMGHPEIHGPSCLAKHEARTCFFLESLTRGTGWGSVQDSGYLTTLLWGNVGSSRNLTLIPLRSIEIPRVAGREQ
jgi:hypothetical protein